ncbi:MAG: carbohydrate ABC transporter permease [Roseiflexaceae bacterium]
MAWAVTQLRRVGFHLLAISAVFIFVAPLAWVLITSLRPVGPPPQALTWPAEQIAWQNYVAIFELIPLARYLLNSLIIVGVAVPLTLTIASLAGFAMSQLPARTRYLLLAIAVVLRMIPISALWLPRFLLFVQLQLIDTYWALIAPVWMGSSPFFILIFYWGFRRMPQAWIESARLDGLGPLGIWWRIALPNAWPALIAVGVLTFAQYWGDFMSPLIYLKSEQRYTMAVGVRTLQQLDLNNWPLMMAGTVVMILPIVVLFILVQRAFWIVKT